MILFDLIQQILFTAADPSDLGNWFNDLANNYSQSEVGSGGGDFTCAATGKICPSAAFTAIGAAFATQGYYVHSDLLYYLTQTEFGLWAPLLYIMAAASGMISMAMGMPPKMYLWFFFGPALYHWLLGTTVAVHGVQWRIANVDQDQRKVWQLAEVGIKNLNIVDRGLQTGEGNWVPQQYEGPQDPVPVSMFFVWFDELISSTVQWLVGWTGVYTQRGGGSVDGHDSGIFQPASSTNEHDRWYLLSNLKWGMLETITSARLSNPAMRDMFVTFLSSECGDIMSEEIDDKNFVAASYSRSGRIPCSVFKMYGDNDATSDYGKCLSNPHMESSADEYSTLAGKLLSQEIPVPDSFLSIWGDRSVGSFACFFGDGSSGGGSGTGGGECELPEFVKDYFVTQDSEALPLDNLSCQLFLRSIIQGFRWEAGHIYHQLITEAPEGMGDAEILFNLFYGWNITTDGKDDLVSLEDSSGGGSSGDGDGGSNSELANWTKDLILIHLIRNEMMLAPQLVDRRYSGEAHVMRDVETYQRSVGSVSKYGEVYTWALMVPYLQGVLMYLLAMGYPFACILIVVPGWHSALFTWMSFWAWVKLWDVGFAIVGTLERSIWAMLGNNSAAQVLSPMIYQMQTCGTVDVSACTVKSLDDSSGTDNFQFDPSACPPIPAVHEGEPATGTGGSSAGCGDPSDNWARYAAIFDRSMLLAANLDFDLANAYYIYIMAALYFAVPAATGQLVLGAKAGAAGMVSNMVGGVASEGGRAGGQGLTATAKQDAGKNFATMRQEAAGKAFRAGGFAGAVFDQNNRGLDAQLASGLAGAQRQGIGDARSALDLTKDTGMNSIQSAGSVVRAAMSGSKIMFGVAVAGGMLPVISALTGGESGGDPSKSAPEGASGATPSGGATGAGNGILRGLWNRVAPADFRAQQTRLATAEGISAMVGNSLTRQLNPQFAGMLGEMANQGVAGFQGQMDSTAAGAAEKRLSNLGDYAGQMASWNASVPMGDSVARTLGAMGADTSVVNPGPKPTDMWGMGLSGKLGGSVRNSGHYAIPAGSYTGQGGGGGYQTAIGDRAAFVGEASGGGKTVGRYLDTSMSDTPKWYGGALGYLTDGLPAPQQRDGVWGFGTEQWVNLTNWAATHRPNSPVNSMDFSTPVYSGK